MATIDETFPPLVPEAGEDKPSQLDDFADQQAASSSPAEAAASNKAPRDEAAAAPHQHIIDTLVNAATAKDKIPDERMVLIDLAHHDLVDQFPALTPFIKEVAVVAARVAYGEVKPDRAKGHLKELAKRQQ